MQRETLMHYGVLGMKWGVRRTPEQLGHKVVKLQTKNESLEQKALRADKKSADHFVKAAKYEQKYWKKSRFILTDFGRARVWRLRKKANNQLLISARLREDAARARTKIEHNKVMIEAMNTQISQMNAESIQLGASYFNDLEER